MGLKSQMFTPITESAQSPTSEPSYIRLETRPGFDQCSTLAWACVRLKTHGKLEMGFFLSNVEKRASRSLDGPSYASQLCTCPNFRFGLESPSEVPVRPGDHPRPVPSHPKTYDPFTCSRCLESSLRTSCRPILNQLLLRQSKCSVLALVPALALIYSSTHKRPGASIEDLSRVVFSCPEF